MGNKQQIFGQIFIKKLNLFMELLMIFKILFIIGLIIAVYAIIRNFDIIKIIFNYWKDSIFRK